MAELHARESQRASVGQRAQKRARVTHARILASRLRVLLSVVSCGRVAGEQAVFCAVRSTTSKGKGEGAAYTSWSRSWPCCRAECRAVVCGRERQASRRRSGGKARGASSIAPLDLVVKGARRSLSRAARLAEDRAQQIECTARIWRAPVACTTCQPRLPLISRRLNVARARWVYPLYYCSSVLLLMYTFDLFVARYGLAGRRKGAAPRFSAMG